MQGGEGASGRDLEDGAAEARAAIRGRAVEAAIGGLDEACQGETALRAEVGQVTRETV